MALINTEAFTIQKEEAFEEVPATTTTCAESVETAETSSTDPPHLLLADLASQRLDLENQGVTPEDKTADGGITLDDDVRNFYHL